MYGYVAILQRVWTVQINNYRDCVGLLNDGRTILLYIDGELRAKRVSCDQWQLWLKEFNRSEKNQKGDKTKNFTQAA